MPQPCRFGETDTVVVIRSVVDMEVIKRATVVAVMTAGEVDPRFVALVKLLMNVGVCTTLPPLMVLVP